MRHWRQPSSAGPNSGATAVGLSGQLQMELRRNLWAAPARLQPARLVWRLPAPAAGCCNAMKGLTIMSCPAQTKITPEIA